MGDKRLGECIRWIGDDGTDVKGRGLFKQEVDPAFGVCATAFD